VGLFGQEILTKTLLQRKQPNIKQGLPVEKKTIFTVVFILALLSSAVAGTQLAKVGRANPFSQSIYSGEMSTPLIITPPSITMLSPLNGTTCNENFVILAFDAVVGQAPYSLYTSKIFNGLSLADVYYEADWLENKAVVNGTSRFTYVYNSTSTAENPYDKYYGRTTGSYSCNVRLEDVPEGYHTIRIKATERGYYYHIVGGISFKYYGYSKSAILLVNFIVDSVPIVLFLSFENRTFAASDVPLNFTVNQAVSKIAYCLDGQENVTISGNTTLTELPNGEHNVTVYATDDTGNTGASETIIFNVDKPEPPEPPEPFPTTLVATASAASVAIIGAGLLVYFKKRKH